MDPRDKLRRSKYNRRMTNRACFIIAPIGAKLGALAKVIVQSGWRVLNAEPDAVSGASLGSLGMIANADAVIVVDPWVSPNLLIETGIALGRGTPVLLVTVDGASMPMLENEPVLAILPRVRAKLTDASALSFHIPAFLAGVEKSLGAPLLTPPTPPLQIKSSGRRTPVTQGYSQMEAHFFDLLNEAPEVAGVVQDPYRQADPARGYRPDFAIWLTDTQSAFLNPVLVEVTRRLTPSEAASRIELLRNYAFEASAGMVLLIEDDPALPLALVEVNPLIVRGGLAQFDHLLRAGHLVGAVAHLRNRLFHGLD